MAPSDRSLPQNVFTEGRDDAAVLPSRLKGQGSDGMACLDLILYGLGLATVAGGQRQGQLPSAPRAPAAGRLRGQLPPLTIIFYAMLSCVG